VSNVDLTANVRLDVGYGNIENLALDLRQGVDVPGQIYTETQPPENFRANSISVSVVPVDNLPAPVRAINARVSESGSFVIQNVAGTRYRVNVTGASGGGYVVDAKYGGFNALAEPVQIDTEGIPLQILIGFNPGKVETVVENAGRPFAGASVVLIPANRARVDLYKGPVRSGSDGKATFSNVPPGDYKLFAWETVKQNAYQNATFMDRYEDRGHLVHIDKGGTATDTHLQVIRSEP
jgi:hypothetical protein